MLSKHFLNLMGKRAAFLLGTALLLLLALSATAGATDPMVLEVVDLVNAARLGEGLTPVAYNADLEAPATKRAQEAMNTFTHKRADGSSWSTVLGEYGIRTAACAENLAWGHETPDFLVESWLKSESHRKNILNPAFTEIGMARVYDGDVVYWSQIFIKPEEEAAEPVLRTATDHLQGMPRATVMRGIRLNVREQNYTKARVVGELIEDEEVYILAREGSWVQIETPAGLTGWVASKYLVEGK